jgi:hypothetical protein
VTVFADIADHDEDTRIEIIGHAAVDHQQVTGFIVETDAKADRYVRKLQEKYPLIRIIARSPGPVAGTVLVKVGPPLN